MDTRTTLTSYAKSRHLQHCHVERRRDISIAVMSSEVETSANNKYICNMNIRKATYEDLPHLMELFINARRIMRASGNMNQWNDNYPSEEIVRKDISDGVCYVLTKEDSKIIATMAFIPGPDPTYAKIYDGQWLDDSPYYVIHRIAVCEPGHNAAERLFAWAFQQTKSIRIDTHKDNVIMHHILSKQGFTHCGRILLANGDPREAFQKNI